MRRALVVGAVCVVGLGVVLGLRARNSRRDKEELPTAVVTRRTLRATVLATGVVQAQIGAEVKVGARVSGRVKRLYANIGDVVTRGQVIAELEQEDLVAQFDKARAEARGASAKSLEAFAASSAQPAQTQAGINQARAALSAASAKWREAKAASDAQPVQSASLIEQAERTLHAAREHYESAKADAEAQPQETAARVAQAEASLKVAQANLALVKRGARTEEIAQAEATVRQAAAKATDAKLKLQRAQKLFAQDYVPRQEVDSRQADYDAAVAQLDAAREQLTLTRTRTTPEDLAKAQGDVQHAEAVLRSAKVGAVQDELKRKTVAATQADVQRTGAALRAAKALAVQDELKRQQVASADAEIARTRAALREAEAQAVQDEMKRHEATASRAQSQAARATTQVQAAQLSYATITAPLTGIIASVATQEGETVAAGLTAPTFVTIVDLSKLQVDAYVDETDIGKVKIGQPVTFTVDAYPDKDFTGRVTAIYPKAVIQQNVVSYDTVITIDDSGGLLKPDMTASVILEVGERSNVLTVPNKAVKREEGEKVVYVMEQGKPVRRNVRTGWKDSDYTEILAGLKEGDRVLLEEPVAAEKPRSGSLPPGATSR
ncbi:MAG: hypothetical protein CO096_16890 [Armatimonadetes bacterium CG_4_9_14_3_um_filter_66_14]|nr:MAG: hypothetical protein CO096_16890 [Armatimonadetes bacterium CG_4_9_14_3_um_filter_66_14]